MKRSADLQFGLLTGGQRPEPGTHLPRLIAAKQSLAVQSWPSDPGRACRRMNSSGDIIKCVAPSLPSPASIPSRSSSIWRVSKRYTLASRISSRTIWAAGLVLNSAAAGSGRVRLSGSCGVGRNSIPAARVQMIASAIRAHRRGQPPKSRTPLAQPHRTLRRPEGAQIAPSTLEPGRCGGPPRRLDRRIDRGTFGDAVEIDSMDCGTGR